MILAARHRRGASCSRYGVSPGVQKRSPEPQRLRPLRKRQTRSRRHRPSQLWEKGCAIHVGWLLKWVLKGNNSGQIGIPWVTANPATRPRCLEHHPDAATLIFRLAHLETIWDLRGAGAGLESAAGLAPKTWDCLRKPAGVWGGG